MRISLIIHKCGRHEGHPVIENALSSSAAGSYPTISKRAKVCSRQARVASVRACRFEIKGARYLAILLLLRKSLA